MTLVLGVFGWYLLVVGALLCARPSLGKRLANWWLKDKLSRPWALVPFGLGLLLLWAAPASRAPRLIQVMGGLGVLKGAYLLLAPAGQLAGVVRWWHQLSPSGHRWWGLMSLLLGAAILVTR